MCLITHVDLDHLIFDQRFALFETLLLLKIKLLNPRINVEWLDVIILLRLTNRCHVGELLFEDYPHTTIIIPAGRIWRLWWWRSARLRFWLWRRSDLSQPLTQAVIIVVRFSFGYERLRRYAPPFIEIQTISAIKTVSNSFYHAVRWPCLMKELWKFIVWFSRCRGLSLVSAEYNWWLVPSKRRDNEDKTFIVLYMYTCHFRDW